MLHVEVPELKEIPHLFNGIQKLEQALQATGSL